jgi:RNA polymerase sigma-70 factor (ECF subfamily)
MSSEPLQPSEVADLSDRIRSGDADAEAELVRLFRRRIYVMSLARVRDAEAARDLTQEVLLAIVCALRNGQLRDAEKLGPFVYGTARNVINNYLRTRQQQPPHGPIPDDLPSKDGQQSLETAERLALVHAVLRQLGAVERKVLLLSLDKGLTPNEIAPVVGMTPELVRTCKSRALKKVVERITNMTRPRRLRH